MNISKCIDHALLTDGVTGQDVVSLIMDAKEYEFGAVCVHPRWIKTASLLLGDEKIRVCTVIGFPFGASTIETKLYEAKNAIQKGADEVEIVVNTGLIKEGNHRVIKEELDCLVKVITENKVTSKVIIETPLLTMDEIARACDMVNESGVDYIKTSTGFGKKDTNIENIIEFLNSYVRPDIGIVATCNIKNFKDAMSLIRLGASRLGVSNGVQLINEYRRKYSL